MTINNNYSFNTSVYNTSPEKIINFKGNSNKNELPLETLKNKNLPKKYVKHILKNIGNIEVSKDDECEILEDHKHELTMMSRPNGEFTVWKTPRNKLANHMILDVNSHGDMTEYDEETGQVVKTISSKGEIQEFEVKESVRSILYDELPSDVWWRGRSGITLEDALRGHYIPGKGYSKASIKYVLSSFNAMDLYEKALNDPEIQVYDK